MASETEFFDILYLGVFAIISTAFDEHFYNSKAVPRALFSEISFAIGKFIAILHRFEK